MPKAKKPRKPKLPAVITAPTYKAAAKELKKVDPDILRHVLLGSGDMRFEALANDLERTPYSWRNKYTLAELCGQRKIKLPDVAKLFAEEMMALGRIEQAMQTPDILKTNAEAAVGRQVPCPTCTVENYAGGPCLTCGETGWVKQAGDPTALKFFADSTGISGRGAPMVNVNLNQFNGAGSFEDLMAKAEKPKQILEVKAE